MKTFLTTFLLPLLAAAAAGLVAVAYHDVMLFLELALPLMIVAATLACLSLGWLVGLSVIRYRLIKELPDSKEVINQTVEQSDLPNWATAAFFVIFVVLLVAMKIADYKIERMEKDVEAQKAATAK